MNTGTRTIFGSISERLTERREETSFDNGVRSFTWLMIRFMVVMVCAVFFIVGMTKGDWVEALLFGLSVAVGLTPEMLPMIVTVNLAKGALAMAQEKGHRQAAALHPELRRHRYPLHGQDRHPYPGQGWFSNGMWTSPGSTSDDVLNYAYLNSYYQTGLRNLIDRAVLDHSDLDVEQCCTLVDELPFDFQRRRMSVVVDYEGDHVLICKGAVEEIYDCCTHYQIGDEVYPLIEMIREDLFEEVERLNKDGYPRAGHRLPRISRVQEPPITVADESELILLGYIAFCRSAQGIGRPRPRTTAGRPASGSRS